MSEIAGSIDIGTVARTSGLATSTLHVWERHGVLQPSHRTGGRRQYDLAVFDRIATILLLQRSGFSLSEIQQLLAPQAFDDGKAALEQKLASLLDQRRLLDEAINGLTHAIACPAPSPLDCEGFRRHLDYVLPVRRPRDGA